MESITKLKKGLKTTLTNVPALIETLEKGISEIGEEISTSADVKKATDNFETINGGLLSECKVQLTPVQSGSGDPSPTNIRAISGHTQVEVDVSDGQTTQEQITVQIGQTVYGGNVDLVSGVMDVNNKSLTFDGTESWWDGTTANYYQFNLNISDTIKYNTIIANELPSITVSERGSKNGVIKDQQDKTLRVSFTLTNTLGINSLSDFKTWLGNNNLQICYEITSPTTINLTPQQVKALVGENHLSASLDGQEIVEVGYKEIFTFEDVEKDIDNAVASIYPEAPSTDGTYVLTLVKSGSNITRSWESTSINANKKK